MPQRVAPDDLDLATTVVGEQDHARGFDALANVDQGRPGHLLAEGGSEGVLVGGGVEGPGTPQGIKRPRVGFPGAGGTPS